MMNVRQINSCRNTEWEIKIAVFVSVNLYFSLSLQFCVVTKNAEQAIQHYNKKYQFFLWFWEYLLRL